jgi:daunorubicin resistance protein C
MSATVEVRALTRRELLRTVRNPPAAIQSVAFPAILMLVLLAVFGEAVGEVDGLAYIQRLAPALIISGAAFGSAGAAVGLFTDLGGGVWARLRTLPITRTGTLVARWIAEGGRVLGGTLVLGLIAVALGFRFRNGVLPALGFVPLAIACGASFCWIGFALAVRAKDQESLVPPMSAIFLVLLFLSRGMVPIDAFPGWAQPIARNTPTSVMVEALQNLANGGALVGPVLGALAWAAGITVVFGALAVRGLARRAM